jgi:hypothetical protein
MISVCVLQGSSFILIGYIASNDGMTMNAKLKSMYKEVIVAYLKVLSLCLSCWDRILKPFNFKFG